MSRRYCHEPYNCGRETQKSLMVIEIKTVRGIQSADSPPINKGCNYPIHYAQTIINLVRLYANVSPSYSSSKVYFGLNLLFTC